MIQYVDGDLFDGVKRAPGRRFILHICNDLGGWGSGFVVALSRHYPEAEHAYRDWFEKKLARDRTTPFALGEVDFVVVSKDIIVANMIAQVGTGPSTPTNPRVHYEALGRCLAQVVRVAQGTSRRSFHLPRIGCDLGGGSWAVVEKIIQQTLLSTPAEGYAQHPPVTVYTLPGSRFNP